MQVKQQELKLYSRITRKGGKMKSIYNIEQFTKERDKALLSLDKEKILAFYAKYGLPYAKKDKVFWATVYKCIYHIDASTKKQKAEAKQWLLQNGFTTKI